MEMAYPKSSNALQLLLIENAHAVRWPEQTVSHHHIRKVLKALLLGQPLLERMLKHMGRDFHHRRKLLELPRLKFIDDSQQEFGEQVEEADVIVGGCDCSQFGSVWLKNKSDVVLVELAPCSDLGI